MQGYEKFWDIISVEKGIQASAERKGKEEGLMEGKRAEQRLIAAN